MEILELIKENCHLILAITVIENLTQMVPLISAVEFSYHSHGTIGTVILIGISSQHLYHFIGTATSYQQITGK